MLRSITKFLWLKKKNIRNAQGQQNKAITSEFYSYFTNDRILSALLVRCSSKKLENPEFLKKTLDYLRCVLYICTNAWLTNSSPFYPSATLLASLDLFVSRYQCYQITWLFIRYVLEWLLQTNIRRKIFFICTATCLQLRAGFKNFYLHFQTFNWYTVSNFKSKLARKWKYT